MKQFILVVVIAAVIVGGKSHFTEEEETRIKEVHEECRQGLDLDDDDFEQAKLGHYGSHTDLFKQHALCFVTKYEMMDEDGNFLMDNIRKHVDALDDDDQSSKIMETCLVQRDSPIETAWSYATCVMSIVYAS